MKRWLVLIAVIWACWGTVWPDSMGYAAKCTTSLGLTWQAPTTNADGTPLTDLAGYKVYWGTATGIYSQNRDVGLVTSEPYSALSLTTGNWFFAVTAYDTSGNESQRSNEATCFFDLVAPSAPISLVAP